MRCTCPPVPGPKPRKCSKSTRGSSAKPPCPSVGGLFPVVGLDHQVLLPSSLPVPFPEQRGVMFDKAVMAWPVVARAARHVAKPHADAWLDQQPHARLLQPYSK